MGCERPGEYARFQQEIKRRRTHLGGLGVHALDGEEVFVAAARLARQTEQEQRPRRQRFAMNVARGHPRKDAPPVEDVRQIIAIS